MVVDDESMYEINKRDAEGVYTACMSLVFFVCPLADGWVVIDDEFLHETVNVMTTAHRPRGLIRCPATVYICVHFMRFFWKLTPESKDHTGVNCKIMRVRVDGMVCVLSRACTTVVTDCKCVLRWSHRPVDPSAIICINHLLGGQLQ